MSHDLVETDNVDVTMKIGGGTSGIPEQEWEIIDAEVVLSTRSTPDYVDMRIVPSKDVPLPDAPQESVSGSVAGGIRGYVGRELTLDVDNQLRANIDGPEVTRVFTGNIANMTALGDYSYEAIAYDPSQQQFEEGESTDATSFLNSTVDITPASPLIRRNITSNKGYYDTTLEPGERKILVSELINVILDEAGIPDEDREIEVQRGGVLVGVAPGGRGIRKGFNPEITFSNWEPVVSDALDRAAAASHSDWWFDRFGQFHFGPRRPNVDIYAYSLEYITDASDGKTTPPYQSVRVIGDGVVSEEGWSKSSLIREDPVTSTLTVNREQGKLAEPTFVYRNNEINTQQEADNVANKLIQNLIEQSGNGSVTVVGFPEIRPSDAIEMPNTERQPMGGARYGVGEVRHILNAQNGFVTKISVMGLVDEQEVFYTDTLSELEESLPDWRSGTLDPDEVPYGLRRIGLQ